MTTTELAQDLRRNMSPPELRLWDALRARRLAGLKFRRQHPFPPYVLDFYCPEKQFALEVDGQGHGFGDQPQRDARKDAFLREQGIRVLRLSAQLVFTDIDAAVRTILGALENLTKR